MATSTSSKNLKWQCMNGHPSGPLTMKPMKTNSICQTTLQSPRKNIHASAIWNTKSPTISQLRKVRQDETVVSSYMKVRTYQANLPAWQSGLTADSTQ